MLASQLHITARAIGSQACSGSGLFPGSQQCCHWGSGLVGEGQGGAPAQQEAGVCPLPGLAAGTFPRLGFPTASTLTPAGPGLPFHTVSCSLDGLSGSQLLLVGGPESQLSPTAEVAGYLW